MKDDAKKFHKVIDHYKMSNPISKKMRKKFRKDKEKTLRAILREKRDYGLVLSGVLSIFFLFRNLGRGISTAASMVIFIMLSFLITAGILAGIYFVVVRSTMISNDNTIKSIIEPDHNIANGTLKREKTSIKNERSKKRREFVRTNSFNFPIKIESDTIKREILYTTEQKIVRYFDKQKKKINDSYILLGNVDFLEGVYFVNLKIIEIESKQVKKMLKGQEESIKGMQDLFIDLTKEMQVQYFNEKN